MAKKTTELILALHKNIIKLVYLWPNMGKKVLQSVNDEFFKEINKLFD